VKARFRWREAASYLHIPILQKLFYDFANPAQLGALKLDEVLDWAVEALNRVDRASFFSTFEQSHAVQYFYEPFLEAFDPELRKELGVWYTPPEIVIYMVARVDTVLREELDIPDGLADPRVVVLDLCCGTGAYLVEVLNKIASTLRAKGDDALLAHDLKQAAMSRVYGFEILPAPFVISHLQIGMLLHRLGAPFADDSDERAGVYLTNALTGWEPPTEPKQHLLFTEMEEERDKAQHVKQHAPILVILGNPPYSIFAGAAVEEERDLVEAYRTTQRVAAPQGRGLNDLYVRFFRMSERRITEGPEGRGVVCFISNYSWLDGLSFTGMRERYLEVFDRIWIDSMNGDKYKTGKLTPEGLPDPSVFSTEHNREGIQVGTAVSLLVSSTREEGADVGFRNLWGGTKRDQLLHSRDAGSPAYEEVVPSCELGLPFSPGHGSADYFQWPLLSQLMECFLPAVKTSRDLDLVAIDAEVLRNRINTYFDPTTTDHEVRVVAPNLMTEVGGFRPTDARAQLTKLGIESGEFLACAYRPFDHRTLYWNRHASLLDRPRPDLKDAWHKTGTFLVCRPKGERSREGSPFLITRGLPEHHYSRPAAVCFPLRVTANASLLTPETRHDGLAPNWTARAEGYAQLLGIADLASTGIEPLASHVLAIGHSPAYLQENASALRLDWPRIPLPATRDALLASAELGRTVAALLDVEEPVDAVTTGSIRHELRPVSVLASVS